MSYNKLLLAGLLAASLAACSNPTVPDPEPMEPAMDDVSDTDGYDDGSFGGGEEVPYGALDEGLAHIIYFDFDSSELRPQDTETVARHAVQLGQNASARVRLEGHADERGSREYNIGLGERRAQTVRRMLLIQGATAAQISTVSFGEERPAVEGSDERAYSQNRRVEITYTN